MVWHFGVSAGHHEASIGHALVIVKTYAQFSLVTDRSCLVKAFDSPPVPVIGNGILGKRSDKNTNMSHPGLGRVFDIFIAVA